MKDKGAFLDSCDEILEGFLDKMSPLSWQRKGIFFTEALAFIAMCKKYRVDTIIESGVRNGDSTEMWLNYFGKDVKVFSVDLMDHEDDVSAAVKRLSHHENLEFKRGDGEVVVPKIVENLPSTARVGMLLDGPKSFGAMRITEKCFKMSDVVKFTSIHDMGEGALKYNTNPEYLESIKTLKSWPNYTFITDDADFRNRFSFVDNKLGGENNKDWSEYKAKYEVGCGLAFVERGGKWN